MFYLYLGYPDILFCFSDPLFCLHQLRPVDYGAAFDLHFPDFLIWQHVTCGGIHCQQYCLRSHVLDCRGDGAALASRAPLGFCLGQVLGTLFTLPMNPLCERRLGDDVITVTWCSVVPRCFTRL